VSEGEGGREGGREGERKCFVTFAQELVSTLSNMSFLPPSLPQEPLLVSYMYSSILNHKSLERSVAFHMATKLATPSLIGTQIETLFLQCFEVRYTPPSLPPSLLFPTYGDQAGHSFSDRNAD